MQLLHVTLNQHLHDDQNADTVTVRPSVEFFERCRPLHATGSAYTQALVLHFSDKIGSIGVCPGNDELRRTLTQ